MQEQTLDQLVTIVLEEMISSGFAKGTHKIYVGIFKRLQKLAEKQQQLYYTPELGALFISDSAYSKGGDYCHSRFCLHSRCIQFLESFLNTGSIDWSINRQYSGYEFKADHMEAAYYAFEELMYQKGLSNNTIDGYNRFVRYFFQYLEDKKYTKLEDIQKGDIIEFISLVSTEHYSPTSLGAHMPGLKLLLISNEHTSSLAVEIPEHLPKKRDILEIYSDEEYEKIKEYISISDSLSYRNKALCTLAIETGLRAVDICNLKLSDIDWKHDCITIIQQKTSKPLSLPLSKSVGNTLIDYLLRERHQSSSEYVFLTSVAPFSPIITHSGCRNILRNIIDDAGVESNGRIYGTRITRHSMASRMLRHGVPLPVISEALGHSNQNSAMIYITTDDIKLSECTLPLPFRKEVHDCE